MVGTLITGCRCAMPWSDLDLTFNFAVATLTYKIFLDISRKPYGVGSSYLALTLDRGEGVQRHGLDLDFDL